MTSSTHVPLEYVGTIHYNIESINGMRLASITSTPLQTMYFLILAIEKFQHLEELISTFRADWTKAMILLEKMNKIQTSFWACSLMVTPLSSSLPAAPQVVPIHSSNTFFFLLCWPGLQHHLLSWPGPQHQHTSFSSTPLLARATLTTSELLVQFCRSTWTAAFSQWVGANRQWSVVHPA